MTAQPSKTAIAKAQAELAQRLLAKRQLIPFIKRFNPKYKDGWVHQDICRRLERFSQQVAEEKSPRLMLLMPPRHGKSEIVSRNFPPWHLGHHPDHEFIACSYNVSLAMDFSRKVKGIITDPLYEPVFPGTRLDPNNQSAESWGVEGERGGYVAAGIGGPITGKGAHCFPAGTLIATPHGPTPIEWLVIGDEVYSFDVEHSCVRIRRVVASISMADRPVITRDWITCTPDQKVFDGAAYTPADRAASGFSAPMQDLLGSDSWPILVREQANVLLDDLSRPGLVRQVAQIARHGLQAVRNLFPAAKQQIRVLHSWLQGRSTQHRHARGRELELQARPGIHGAVQAAADSAGPHGMGPQMRGVREGQSGDASHQRAAPGRPALEPGSAVQGLPHGVPQERRCSLEAFPLGEVVDAGVANVYDVEVEGLHNFFVVSPDLTANCLMSNCLVIDDPIKNAEEADSPDIRAKIWEWYLSTAYSRLAPGGGVLIIQTWWHDDDLAGKLQTMMKEGSDDEYVDQFEVIKYPAMAEADEYLNHETDLIEYDAPPEAAHTLLRRKGEALHPARYDEQKLLRIKAQNKGGRWWSALYQQNPVPADGSYFTKDQFRRGQPPQVRDAHVYVAWDFAISEKKQNDYTVGTVGLQDTDDVLHVVDQLRFKSGDAFFIVEAILNLAVKWYSPTLLLGFEDGQIYRAIEALLKKRMRERKIYPSIVVLKPITDKMARARSLQGRMQQGMVSFSINGEWYDSLRTEMLRFPAGAHDDQVDSLAWMAQLVVGREAPRKAEAKQMKSWRDKLTTLGSHTTFMSA